MFRHKRAWHFLVPLVPIAIVWILVLGCAERADLEPAGTVSGRVTFQQKPLPTGCTLMFVSDHTTAVGSVEPNGQYQLKSGDSNRIPVGKYRVAVNPPAPANAPLEGEETAGDDTTWLGEDYGDLIPRKYRNVGTSGLAFEVQEGENTFDIKLQ